MAQPDDLKAEARAEEDAELTANIREAEGSSSWQAVAALRRQRQIIRGIDSPPIPIDDRPLPDDPLAAALEEAQRLRRDAQRAGVWTAVQRFHGHVMAAREAITERDRVATEAARVLAGDGEMFDQFAIELEDLSDVVVERLASLCSARLGE
jgi:hypothetical protein